MVSMTFRGEVRQTAALGYLGSKISRKIWTNDEKRSSMSRIIAVESEHLLSLVRRAGLSHKEQYYSLRKARYLEARAENMKASPLDGLGICQE